MSNETEPKLTVEQQIDKAVDDIVTALKKGTNDQTEEEIAGTAATVFLAKLFLRQTVRIANALEDIKNCQSARINRP